MALCRLKAMKSGPAIEKQWKFVLLYQPPVNILLLARQGLAIRGDGDECDAIRGDGDEYDANFIQLFKFLGQDDVTINEC
ncbi:hypothetical protein EMCRGX_G028788 [Ephydatia muelleri]